MNNPNNKNNIVFFEVKDWEKEHITKALGHENLSLCEGLLTTENAKEFAEASVISTFIDSKITKEVIDTFPNLKMISTRSTGYDHIDVAYAKSKGIYVSNVPNYGKNTVAEHGAALLLSVTKRIGESVKRVRDGNFDPEGLTGVDLMGKTIGIVGTGNIGRFMIKIANGFSMKVIAYDLKPDTTFEKDYNFKYVSFEELLAESDFISLHLPYFPETHHIINRAAIDKMKNGVVIINTSRGGLIETDALYDGLKSGKVAGAGLDVVEEEGFIKEELKLLHNDKDEKVDYKTALENHAMARFVNVVMTPHNAFNTKEALLRITETTLENITCYTQGSCKNLI